MGNPAAGWTEDRRQRQREAIQRWRPWSKSTGPKSPEGKAVTAKNACAGSEPMKLRWIAESGHAGAAGRAEPVVVDSKPIRTGIRIGPVAAKADGEQHAQNVIRHLCVVAH